MRKLIALIMAGLILAPAAAMAQPTVEELQDKIDELWDEIDYLSESVSKNERHTALDNIMWDGDLRVTADTLHYQDVTFNPGVLVDYTDFFQKAAQGMAQDPNAPLGTMTPGLINMATRELDLAEVNTPLDRMFANLYQGNRDLFDKLLEDFGAFSQGVVPGIGAFPMSNVGPQTHDIDNDIIYTTRLRLGMKAKVYKNVGFAGRLVMYKNWGDSTGSKVFDSWNAFTMDGTDSGNTTGDWLRVERAYFDWKNIGGSDFYLSIGRRPSTYGPPSQYRENELRGGTPSGHLVNFNFDGITVGYNLSELTGIEGQVARFCYGQGFESEWGNGELFPGGVDTDDVHLGGFNIDALNDGTNFLQFTLFQALDVTDGFKGLMAFPNQYAALFAPTMYRDLQKFDNFNFVTRVQPSTNIGDITLGGVGFSREEMNGIKWFGSFGWTRTDGNGEAGMFGGLLSDAVFQAQLTTDGQEVYMAPVSAEEDDTHNGYSIYAGVQIPAPMGKLGLEYNWGSKYWVPFTQAQDDLIGSKLATRGHVGEAYYIFDVNPNMYITVGGKYYDYKFTGSGSPVGEPKKVDDVNDGTAYSMLPAVDTAWDGYAKLTVQF